MLFQGHVACLNLTLTELQQKFIEMFLIMADYFYFKSTIFYDHFFVKEGHFCQICNFVFKVKEAK